MGRGRGVVADEVDGDGRRDAVVDEGGERAGGGRLTGRRHPFPARSPPPQRRAREPVPPPRLGAACGGRWSAHSRGAPSSRSSSRAAPSVAGGGERYPQGGVKRREAGTGARAGARRRPRPGTSGACRGTGGRGGGGRGREKSEKKGRPPRRGKAALVTVGRGGCQTATGSGGAGGVRCRRWR